MKSATWIVGWVALWGWALSASAEYPVDRPPRKLPLPDPQSQYVVCPDRPKQLIQGLGVEIQSDSIASGNTGLPTATTSAPHDLVPEERERLCRELLKGFRFCRLAAGLYWRGLDAEQKHFQGRWPEQMDELRDMLRCSGIEGVSLEYWSPAPFWKANAKLTGSEANNVLRCFGKSFDQDPIYHGDTNRFLRDYAEACRQDLQYLRDHGIKVSFWGLQNEPGINVGYSSCFYAGALQYCRVFQAVAPAVHAFDTNIVIIADTAFDPSFSLLRPVLDHPAQANPVDALAIHHVGSDANEVKPCVQKTWRTCGKTRPVFQNEYEYLAGPTSPARCLNTVLHIMNWFELGEAPTWFWIHALKPVHNAEASGYSLGFWHPSGDTAGTSGSGKVALQPGHWTWNPYNWNAVGSFLRHMPWNCRCVEVQESRYDDDLRIFAFARPDGKLTVALANRSGAPYRFKVVTGLERAQFKGFRYTPSEAGTNCLGAPIGLASGPTLTPELPDLSWEFWEEQ